LFASVIDAFAVSQCSATPRALERIVGLRLGLLGL
jgi:hypothetical protein